MRKACVVDIAHFEKDKNALWPLIYGGPLQFSDSFNAQQGLSHVIYKRGGKRSPQRLYVRYNFVTVAAVDSVDGASSKVPCSLGSLVDTI